MKRSRVTTPDDTAVEPVPEPVPVTAGPGVPERSGRPRPEDRPQPSDPIREAPRGPADPVRALMHQYHELCARAVDPLEIAAGLEARGATDRTAANCRHRDIFALAEELYARVPRDDAPEDATVAPDRSLGARSRRAALHLLPGAACAATVAALSYAGGAAPAVRIGVGACGAAAAAVALRFCLGWPGKGGGLSGALSVGWLIGYALFGDWLLAEVVSGGPDALPTAEPPEYDGAPTALALAFAVPPAAWCARWFAVRSGRALMGSRGLAEFAGRVRPVLPAAVALFLCCVLALVPAARLALGERPYAAPGAVAAAASLAVLLFIARLLAAHGFTTAAVAGTAAACCAEGVAVCAVLIARLPGCDAVARPVTALVAAHGPTAVPTLACAFAALTLLAYCLPALTRATAHTTPRTGQR
ncbi:hypothetical protein AB0I49_15135 [Streptomyces sp. NPDC050617]|uniref:hypothetical protein n=1 Tax=Streptomyces sp. NPDC050617 TaxID=3154628 RepID=UPI003438F2FB